MVKPVVFSDLCKSATEILDDDYTTKYLLKAKTAKVPFPHFGPVVLTIEDEVKGSKGVEGKLTAKLAYQGISFDKITLKGDKYAVEASKDFSGVKMKVKADPFNLPASGLNAEYKKGAVALTADADKKCFSVSAVSGGVENGLFGASMKFVPKSNEISYNVGANCLLNGIFAAVVVSSKSVATFALSFKPLPKLTVAATFASDKKDATVGVKYSECGCVKGLTLAAKSTKDTPSALAVYKMASNATLVASATSKYADLAAKPTFGLQLTLG